MVLFAAACSPGAPSATTATSAPTTTSTVIVPVPGALDESIYDRTLRAVDAPSESGIALVARDMGESGDPGWIPYLVDLLRLVGPGDARNQLAGALQRLTGAPLPDDEGDSYLTYGSWMYRNPVDAGPRYVEWKARLYGLIDPSFADLIGMVDDPVLAARLQWGGVGRGGIPELNDAPVIGVGEASYMTDAELTFGAFLGGEARAYPHRILDHHELANDTLGGVPVALANCTLCRTGVLYDRRVGDVVVDFETSGLLLNSNKVMVDRQTGTLWEQLTGTAVAGPLAGTVLDRHPLTVTTFAAWVAEHPDTGVLAIPDLGFPYSYRPGDAYRSYYDSAELWFPTFQAPDDFAPKAEMATLLIGHAALAVEIAALATPEVLPFAGTMVLVVPTEGGARFYDLGPDPGPVDPAAVATGEMSAVLDDGREAPRLAGGHSFWFAWYGAHPDTDWWPPS